MKFPRPAQPTGCSTHDQQPTLRISDVAVVVIGRNEGNRLRACFDAIPRDVAAVVYVDSGSTDQSLELARERGIAVHELDLSAPFTAGRARNAGVRVLQQHKIIAPFVQFIDGDSSLLPGWLEAALCEFDSARDIAVVCGRCREARRSATIYNTLCDMEWNTPVGDADACGGNAMFRIDEFSSVGGFNESLVAGEEPELCLRLRRRASRIRRIDHDMVEHDADITRFAQWWRRAARCGRAYAEGHALHGASPPRYRARELRSIIEWTVLLPLLSLGLAVPTCGVSLLGLLGYAALVHRIRRHRLNMGDSPRDATLYALFCVLGKFAELSGAFAWHIRRLRTRRTRSAHAQPSTLLVSSERVAA